METTLTQGELSTLLYCLEGMAVDFPEDEEGTKDFDSLFSKLETLADLTPDPNALDIPVLSICLKS